MIVYYVLYIKLIFILILFINGALSKEKLYIGGIFPMTGSWAGGKGCRPAVEMALEDVNARADLLPQFNLEIVANDSRVRLYIYVI